MSWLAGSSFHRLEGARATCQWLHKRVSHLFVVIYQLPCVCDAIQQVGACSLLLLWQDKFGILPQSLASASTVQVGVVMVLGLLMYISAKLNHFPG